LQPSLPLSSESRVWPKKKVFPLQTNSGLNKNYNEFGCYVHCIAKIAWDKGGWDAEDLCEHIMSVVDLAIKYGILTDTMRVMDPDRIFLLYGLDVGYTNRHESPDRKCKAGEVEILYFEAPGDLQHFVVGDGSGNVVWDPYGESKTVRTGKLVSKRIFEIRKVV